MFDNFLIHTFHDGNCLQAYKIFGAHFETHEGKKGVRFTTYAPNARSAQVVGEFNQWGETPCYMEKYKMVVFIQYLLKVSKNLTCTSLGLKLLKEILLIKQIHMLILVS